MSNKTIFYDGRKTVDLWGDDPTGWNVLTGEGAPTPDSDYYKFIPTLYRGVSLRANGVATMPFELLQGKVVYDSSADWKNKVHILPNPFQLFQLIEAALTLCGKAYIFKEKAAINYQGQPGTFTKGLQYHLPTSITPVIDPVKGLQAFTRPVNNQPKRFDVKDYVYFWPVDPFVEIGPPLDYPAKAAANACAVLLNVDMFADNYFARGAIKAMLLTAQGMPKEEERQRLEDWFRRFITGIKNAWAAKVFNAEKITPVIIGEGMKELENVTLGQEKREDISIALGIPMSILFANAANRATSLQDELNFLTKTIVPECEFIASVLNEQLFTPLGLHLNFLPETLDAMQEDENERAAAMNAFMDALSKCDSYEMAEALFDIYGVEISDKALLSIQKHYADKQKRAEDMAKQLAQKPAGESDNNQNGAPSPDGQNNAPGSPQEAPGQAETKTSDIMLADLEKWRRKALNALKKGKSPAVQFESEAIPFYYRHSIMTRLEAATDEATVKAAFVDDKTVTYSNPMPMADYVELIGTLKEAIEAVKVET